MPEYRISVQTEFGLFDDVIRTEKDIDEKEVDVQTQARVDAFVDRIKNPPPAPIPIPLKICTIREEGSLAKGDLEYVTLIEDVTSLREVRTPATKYKTTAEIRADVVSKVALASADALEEKP